MSPRFVLGRKNVPCVAEVVDRSLKADCTDFISLGEKGPIILQSRFTLVLLQVAFYVKARLCRSQFLHDKKRQSADNTANIVCAG